MASQRRTGGIRPITLIVALRIARLPALRSRHPRRPVGESHHPLRDRPAGTLVLVELGLLSPSTEHRGQSATECDRILDTGVHPLPARWAVDVRRVSGDGLRVVGLDPALKIVTAP